MFTITPLPTTMIERIQAIQAIANLESMVQPQDAWGYQTIIELLEQDSMRTLIICDEDKDKDKDKVIGYCLYHVIFEQAEILRIGTQPDYQRQGIASKLFAVLNQELQRDDVESLLLEVRADNAAAIALYEQQGLSVIHRRRGYYQSPHQVAIDALVMQRKF